MELIELVANNQYMFTSDRSVKRGVMEVDTMDALLAQNKAMAQQLTTLNKKMEKVEVASLGTQAEIQTTYGLCGGPHENHNSSLIREDQLAEQANYLGNQANFRNQESAIRNLETQVSQIAKQLSTKLPNAFPIDAEVNPKGECKEITLRSGRALEDSKQGELNMQSTNEAVKSIPTKPLKEAQDQTLPQPTLVKNKENHIPFP
ncbi:hypothetical protein PIB30_075416 [Stylosanthes scabra]|uniref:Uncharacterized protein n=1 Tax=Stylosanthes scabra TaxID=79078 RepID=A0ABU6WPT4_9FABA|nr:hypothetical protein [Stylosanthes scabra]